MSFKEGTATERAVRMDSHGVMEPVAMPAPTEPATISGVAPLVLQTGSLANPVTLNGVWGRVQILTLAQDSTANIDINNTSVFANSLVLATCESANLLTWNVRNVSNGTLEMRIRNLGGGDASDIVIHFYILGGQ